ncbi:MAG TPA: M50 family metallopeptidase [Candidatus Limnocylindria bacterium]|jgi:hypothetical protein|nr:M50 family metallopeptidase [Candidatus Limnocylindria bacterium]
MDQHTLAIALGLMLSAGLVLVGLVVSVLVHELGHTVAGYVAGLRIACVMLGPLEIRDYVRPRVRFVRSLQAGVVLIPRERDAPVGPLRWGLIISTAAGPLAGIAFGAIVSWIMSGGRPSVPQSVLEVIGQCSLILGAVNLLPVREGQVLADGRRLFALLLRGRECSEILVATLMLGEAFSGRRPRDWDRALLDVMERSPNDPFARLCLYEAALDRGEIEAAGRHLDAALTLRTENWTAADAILFNEAAYYAARHRGDARAARAWLGRAGGWNVVDYLRARAEAAVLCAEGRTLEGRQRAVAGLAALTRARRRDADLSREQLEELARGAGAVVRPLLTHAR